MNGSSQNLGSPANASVHPLEQFLVIFASINSFKTSIRRKIWPICDTAAIRCFVAALCLLWVETCH
jgi:hypothetical protein